MSFIDNVERRGLFNLTRYIALLFIFLLVVAIVIGAFAVTRIFGERINTRVKPNEVLDILKPTPEKQESPSGEANPVEHTSPNQFAGVKMPFALQKYFSNPENTRVLKGWLDSLPKGKEQEFLDDLSETLKQTEKMGIDPVRAINTYKEIKLKKITDEKLAGEEFKQTLTYYVAGAFGLVLLIAMLSLILVLLAIERNTRQYKAE